MHVVTAIVVSLAFLALNVVVLLTILRMNRHPGPKSGRTALLREEGPGSDQLDASQILAWEFEYARVTASEAMEQRHTMVNFHLVVAGVMASGALVVFGQGGGFPRSLGTLLLWVLCGVGWLHFLAIVRLRQAWHDSAQAMNRIKEFYIQHAKTLNGDVLRGAFLWQPETLPDPAKPWTVFFYSAMVISLLNSAAFVLGGVLLGMVDPSHLPWLLLGIVLVLGLGFFAFHVWLYFAFLRS
jgi:hypothetical protein